jgi:hypothetical protein
MFDNAQSTERPIMFNTRNARRISGLLAVLATLAGAATANATPLPGSAAPSPTVNPAPVASTQGIIMRDGGVCDPIRHMGC